jgi:hypothetical protein
MKDVGNFLGIKVAREKNGYINLTQPELIDKIVETVGLQSNSSYFTTPSSGPLLTKDSEGDDRRPDFDYRAAVGMIIYLTSSSIPELSFASHQRARFSQNPKRIHEIAVRKIGRYLQGTRDKGYFLNPNNTKHLDCYVDADFAGLWNPDEAQDPTTLKSRTGYVITFCVCPVLRVSKLQTETALSTTEAEYIALSQAMRDLIPMKNLLLELAAVTGIDLSQTITHSTIFEDNKGCVDLVKSPKMRPRTKHIALNYHHLRSHIGKKITIKWISTEYQLADIYPKSMTEAKFQRLRKELMGW